MRRPHTHLPALALLSENLQVVVRVLQPAHLAPRHQRLQRRVDAPLHQRAYSSRPCHAATVRRTERRDDHVGVALVAHVDRVEGDVPVSLATPAAQDQQRALAAAQER